MYVPPGQARVAAPLLALGLGAPVTVLAGLRLMMGGWDGAAALTFVLGLAFAVTGAIALVSLWRKRTGLSGEQRVHGERANVALFAMFALLVGLCCAMFASDLAHLRNDPTQRVAGRVEHIHTRQRIIEQTLSLKLDRDARTLNWSCRFNCGAYAALHNLRDAPWPMAEADRLGRRLVGLRIEGRTYLNPERERARLIRSASMALGTTAVVGLLMALYAFAWFRNRPTAYDGLDPISAARARDAMRRILPDPPRSRR